MLVLAAFIPICVVAVLLMLRFFFALESEIRSKRKRSAARVDHITKYRIPSGNGAHGSAPGFTLVHSSSGLALRGCPDGFLQRNYKSRYKEA
jgi:hypothetical protein